MHRIFRARNPTSFSSSSSTNSPELCPYPSIHLPTSSCTSSVSEFSIEPAFEERVRLIGKGKGKMGCAASSPSAEQSAAKSKEIDQLLKHDSRESRYVHQLDSSRMGN